MKKKNWVIISKRADFKEIAKKHSIDQVTARLLVNRNIATDEEIDEYLYADIKSCHDANLFKDIDKATDIIRDAIRKKLNIRVIGDYDVDGICSTYILTRGLEMFGAFVSYDIPHRIYDGYGLSTRLVEQAAHDNVDVIVTCDNGIAAFDEIKKARELGIKVIVTDHHQVPTDGDSEDKADRLVDADAIVDPKRNDCPYPFKELCGAAVSYKLICVLAQKYGRSIQEFDHFIEIAAIATVCDVVPLIGENRIIVKEGLKRIKVTKNIGLKALAARKNIDLDNLTTYQIGFVIGPCLNAAGRLDSAIRSLQLLLEDDVIKAAALSEELANLNESRKEMTSKGVEEAKTYIENIQGDKVYVVYLPNCHESIAGIIAGRIREEYNHPSIVLTKGETMVKGSARSIDNYDIYAGLRSADIYLQKYGGHKLAAGLSLRQEDISSFRKLINENADLCEDDFVEKTKIDIAMPFSYVNEELINEINRLEPFGTGNEKPVFAQRDALITSVKILGKNKNVLKLFLRCKEDDYQKIYEVISFAPPATFMEYIDDKYGDGTFSALKKNECDNAYISILYYPTINEFKGIRNIQFRMIDYL